MQFSRQYLQRLRGTESRLASSHAGSGAAFDTIQGRRSHRTVNGFQNLSLRHQFTTADHIGKRGIFPDQGFSLLFRGKCHAGNAFSGIYKIRLTFCGINIFNNLCHILTDGGGTGQSRGFNPRHINEPGMPCCLFDEEIRFFRRIFVHQMSTQSGKRSDRLSAVQGIHTVASQVQNLRQSLCRGVYILLIRNILRCRTYQQIAMDSRSYKDTFTHFRGLLENSGIYQITTIFVHQTILTSPRYDADLLFADHIVDFIRIDTCRIDDDGSLEYLTIRLHLIHPSFLRRRVLGPYRSLFHDSCHLVVTIELYAVFRRIFCQRNVQSERTYDAAGGCIQCSHDIPGNRRLHRPYFLRRQKFQFLDPILYAASVQFFQSGHAIFFKAQYQGTVPAKREVQLLRQFLHHFVAPDI